MNHDNYDLLLQDWLYEEGELAKKPFRSKPFIGDRQYRHFDARLPLAEMQSNEAAFLLSELRHPHKLAKHSFYPFVRKDKKIRRYGKRFDKESGEIVPDIRTKNRPIMYASHRDATIFGFYGWMLKKQYDIKLAKYALSENIIAYRKIPRNDGSERNKSNIDFSNDIFKAIGAHNEAAVICLDIKDFFGTMNHQLLKEKWQELLGVDNLPVGHNTIFKNITRYRFIEVNDILVALKQGSLIKGRFHYNKDVGFKDRTGPFTKTSQVYNKEIKNLKNIRTNGSPKGIPQGSPISDILANIYLFDFDRQIKDHIDGFGMGMYRRYSDDILIICPTSKALEIYSIVLSLLSEMQLKISEKKSELFHINRATNELIDQTQLIVKDYSKNKSAIQYLGFEFDLNDVHVRPGTIANYYRKFVNKLRRNREKEQDPYIIVEDKPKRKPKDKKSVKRDRYAYIKKASSRMKSPRLDRQFSNVRKRTSRLRASEKQK